MKPNERFRLFCVCVTAACVLTACQQPGSQMEGAFEGGRLPTPLVSLQAHRLSPDDLPKGRDYLTYGVTPYLGVQTTKEAFAPIARWLSDQLGVEVRFVVANTYDDLLERLFRREVDIVQLSPLSYVVAREQMPGLHLLAGSLSFGAADYSSLLVVRTDFPLHEVKSLRKGKHDGKKFRFGYVHERSASGYLLPYDAFLREGVDPRRDLEMVRLGSHEKTMEALIAGTVDIAAVSSGTLNNVRRGVVIGVGNVRTFHKAGRIPYDAVCVGTWVPKSALAKMASALGALSTRTVEGRKALARARGVTGWIATDDSRYQTIRDMYHRVRADQWRNMAPAAARASSSATPTGAK